MKDKLPIVSIVIPCKNEEKFISKCIDSILANDYPKDKLEIIVVDGGSTDRTTEIVKALANKYLNIRLIGGSKVNCPTAMNIGLKNAKGEVISKIDAHGYIDSNFLKMNIKYLQQNVELKCTGGPINQLGENFIAKANAYGRSSPFGVGVGVYSIGEIAQFVDSVQCGTYKRKIFDEIGLFDELLQYGEDEELNWRIRKAGYKVLCAPEIKFFYYARPSLKELFMQYYHYGNARVQVIMKHPDFIKIKHIVPLAFIFVLGISLVIGILNTLFLWLFVVITLCYLVGSFSFSLKIAKQRGWKYFGIMPVVFATLHISYGTGFLAGLMRFAGRRKR